MYECRHNCSVNFNELCDIKSTIGYFRVILNSIIELTASVIGKISDEDKMRIQTLRELGFGYRKIVAKFPEKGWNLWSVKAACKQFDERGSATEQKPGSRRPRTA